jgi:hypothetical protein
VKISDKVRTVVDVLAILILWFAILLMVGVSNLGDCFTPGCEEAMDRRMRIEEALVAIGFVSHIAGYFWLKAKRARGK